MIVRKKRNTESKETVYIEDSLTTSAFVSTSTKNPILRNMTSMQVAINQIFNSSSDYLNEDIERTFSTSFKTEFVTTQPGQFEPPSLMTSHVLAQDTKFDDITINATLSTTTGGARGNEQIPEDLIWGIDNTVTDEILHSSLISNSYFVYG